MMETGSINYYNAIFAIKSGKEKRLINDLMEASESSQVEGEWFFVRFYNKFIGYLTDRFGSKLPPKEFIEEENSIKVLQNITIDIKKGEKVCVMGEEGSGKSMLLLSLMNELDVEGGNFSYNGKIAYINMKKALWLVGKTIRENIAMEGDSVNNEK